MDKKLIVVILGPGKKHFAEMCLDSVKGADKILYFTNRFIDLPKEIETETNPEFYNNFWDESDKATNGKCRQRYLEHLKENYPDDWCICLDEDEVIDDLQKVKDFINDPDRKPGIYNVKMRHLIGDLGHEDATHPVHVVPGRLFKISEAKGYPLHSHPVLEGEHMGACLDATIWHLGHLPVGYMDYILTRYKQHANDSMIHPPQFLEQWKEAHLFGQYPVRKVNPVELPKQILDRYELDRDKFYFSNYQLELKHSLMVKQWNDYFKPESVLDLGCGRGCYLYFWNWFLDNKKYKGTMGIELSKWAVENTFSEYVNHGDISSNLISIIAEKIPITWNLITAIDVLEHLTYEDLDKTLINMKKHGSQFLFSIPYIGDPNLEADSTHIIKETKEWWVAKLSEYFNIKDAPSDWLYSHQLLVGEKKQK